MSSERLKIALVLLLLPACSVKEKRSQCPCLLSIKLESAPATLRVEGEGFLRMWNCPRDTLLQVKVPRNGVEISTLRGAEFFPDGSVRIAYAYDSPAVYFDACSVDTDSESADATLRPHKSYCALTVVCDGPPGGGEPYWVEFKGNVSGWERNGTLIESPFSYRCVPELDGSFTVRLPRQRDESLRMDILFSDRIVRSFSLGTALSRAAYDWTEPDLPDREIVLSLSLTDITLAPDLWTEDIPLEIEI